MPGASKRASFSSATESAAVALPTANVTVRSAAAPSGKRSRSACCVTPTFTVSAAAVDPVRLSVKPAAPSFSLTTFLSLAIVTTGVSSSLMVPVAVGSAASSARLDGDTPDSVTVKVWSSSTVVSFVTGTVNVVVVAPAATVTMPVVVAVKSAASAVSPLSIDAVQVAVTSSATASDSVTVNSTPSSSAPSASAMLSLGFDAEPRTAMRSSTVSILQVVGASS